METHASTGQINVPEFVTITDVTPDGASEPEFVISNEATGKYFRANRATVQFLDAIKRTGSIAAAAEETGLLAPHVDAMMTQLRNAGVVTQIGETTQAPVPKTPVEGKLISLRGDLINAAPIVRRLEPLGRFLFSPVGYLAWIVAMIATGTQLISNGDKVLYSLRQIPEQGLKSLTLLGLLYVCVKAIHELGHALAYRRFCLRAGFDPGPIRMGIALFAMTPFPFTDVTGAWRLRSRFERVMIGAGGMYIETWTIAILTLIWAHVQAGPAQSMILQVVVISGALTLAFNLNPAVKLDGYYMLTDAIRRPNLAQRGSLAARTWLARWLGADLPSPDGFDLGYWIIAYLYRWTIFAGIFWLAYRLDPNLAFAVLGVTAMILIVRPALATARFLRTQHLSPARLIGACVVGTSLIVALLMPLPDRVLVPAHFLKHETRYIEPPETARLERTDGLLALDNPRLSEDLVTTRLRRGALENTMRSVTATAMERARLQEDINQLIAVEDELTTRLARLNIPFPDAAVWTPMGAETLEGSWVVAASDPLGAISDPVEPFLRMRLPQSALQRGLDLHAGVLVQARPHHAPDCILQATLRTPLDQATILDDSVILTASPETADCARNLPSGAAVVVRIPAPDKTLLMRIWITASRLLQDRLPVNVQPEL